MTITVTDVAEPPARPAAPSVSSVSGSTTSLSVIWTAPSNTGPAITNYDLRYRQGSSGPWTNGPQNVIGTSAEGTSPWSPSWTGQTGAARSPGLPTNLRSTPGDGQVTLHWMAPSDTGGAPITHYEYERNGDGNWISTGSAATSYTVSGLTNDESYTFRIRAVNSAGEGTISESRTVTPRTAPPRDESDDSSSETEPDPPRELLAESKIGAVTLSWNAPKNDGGAKITDYEYQIDGEGEWISIGSANRMHTITGLTNGRVYVFRVRAVNRFGRSLASNRVEATPGAVGVVLDFAHFANGDGIISDFVFLNVSPHPTRLALYFYDQGGDLIDSALAVDVTGDLVVAEDGSLTVLTEMEPLGQLSIATHGRGDLVSGSVRVVSDGPIGGMLRFDHPSLGVAGVAASPPLSAVIFPVRRQEGGINTGVALHNLGSGSGMLRCAAMQSGKGCSPPWPWKWTPAPAPSSPCRRCRFQRCRLRNRRKPTA